MEGAAAMKQRNLRPAVPIPSNMFAGERWIGKGVDNWPFASWWFEFDEHGCDIVWRLRDGRVYRSSGILETPVRDDLRRPLEAGS